MKETEKIKQENGVTHITVVQDHRPQIGDKVKFLIVEEGVMRMVKGRILNVNYENQITSVVYEGKTYTRTFEQIEQVEQE